MSKEREQKILEYMKQHLCDKGYPPTVREICAALNIKSTSTVHYDLANLVKDGFIKKDPAKPRALVLVEQEGSEPTPIKGLSHAVSNHSDVIEIPIVGRIAAGTPILAEQNIEDSLPIPARYIAAGSHFLLSVRGESMIEAGIMDGDYILVRQQSTARNGEIVVAMVDGFESEATVKTFYKEEGHVRLQPENPTMSPIIVNDVRILGKVTGVFRFFN